MRISDLSSDVCSSDLFQTPPSLPSLLTRFGWLRWQAQARFRHRALRCRRFRASRLFQRRFSLPYPDCQHRLFRDDPTLSVPGELLQALPQALRPFELRSEEHTSELQSLMRISYAVFCLKKKKYTPQIK